MPYIRVSTVQHSVSSDDVWVNTDHIVSISWSPRYQSFSVRMVDEQTHYVVNVEHIRTIENLLQIPQHELPNDRT